MSDIHPGLVAEAVLRSGIYWFAPEHAQAVIREARQIGLPLLGFDGAFLTKDWVQPSQADSWDYSSRAYPTVDDPYLHALEFILARVGKGLISKLSSVTETQRFPHASTSSA